jgi:predicted  nucleic acid-binding Zn-ribbon protein
MTEAIRICQACGGNGFVRVPHSIYADADQHEIVQCDTCLSSGEVQPAQSEVRKHGNER